jgi:hypothetical protein
MNSKSDNSAVAPGLMRTVETVCGARFMSEKLRLFADTRDCLNGPCPANWQFELYTLDSDAAVTEWLADSLPDPAALLTKYLLFMGFYASSATDLLDYAETVLSELETTSLPVPLYHNVAHDGLLM